MTMKRVAIAVAAVVVLVIGYRLFLSSPSIRNAEPSGQNIICFGDSLTFGTGAQPDHSYPARLERLIGQPVINSGVPGDTTGRALDRLDSDVLAHSPRIVCITLGGNDLMGGVPEDEAFANLRTIVERIHRAGALVVVAGIELPLLDKGYGDGYRRLRRDTGCLLIPNVFEDVMGNPRLMADQIHPNAQGYEVIAERIARVLAPYL